MNQCGVRFTEQVDIAAWVKRVGHLGQQRVDRMLADVRSNTTAKSNATDAKDELRDLKSVSTALSQICERLARSREVCSACPEDLIQLDVIAQLLQTLADRSD